MARDRGVRDLPLSGAAVLVVGGARTGLAAAGFLAGRGARVTLTDMTTLSDKEDEIERLTGLGVSFALGSHDPKAFLSADLIVVSPGVPLFIEPLVAAKKKGVRIIGEVELAARFIDVPIIAVTGTNGKTTTTALLGDILAACGRRVIVGGNIGTPLVEFAADRRGADGDRRPLDYIVAEISSFQLEAIETFRPEVALLLNITPDHLDRYPNYEEYITAKLQIFENQTQDDIAVLNRDDDLVVGRTNAIRARKIFFSRRGKEPDGVFLDGATIRSTIDGAAFSYDPARSRLAGVHNVENIMAAIAGAAAVGCAGEPAARAIERFNPHPHRLEHVLTTPSGVSFFDDSKATNVGATKKSIESFDKNLHVIMGGVDKGGSYEPLVEPLRRRAVGIYLIGEAAPIIEKELAGVVPITVAHTMEAAVRAAGGRARPGDVILLAPACSSFDQYENYQKRGEDFARQVKRYFADGK
jgi:UDP-N-acetylmuramoylalanine--D-glutamate ligase